MDHVVMPTDRASWERLFNYVSTGFQVVAVLISFVLAVALHKGNVANERLLGELQRERAAVEVLRQAFEQRGQETSPSGGDRQVVPVGRPVR